MFTGAGVGLLATDYNQCVFHAALWRGAVSPVVLLMREGLFSYGVLDGRNQGDVMVGWLRSHGAIERCFQVEDFV